MGSLRWPCMALAMVLVIAGGAGAAEKVAAEESVAKDLLGFVFQDGNKDGVPDGYKVVKSKGSEAATLTYDAEVFRGEKGPSVKMHLPKPGYLALDLRAPRKLEKGKQYLFAVDVKIKDMRVEGKVVSSRGVERALLVYVYGMSNKYSFIAIGGNGSTKGWVTMMLPFDTGKIPEMATSRVLLRCQRAAGTIWLQDPTIVELPKGAEMRRHFILEDGSAVANSIMALTNAGK